MWYMNIFMNIYMWYMNYSTFEYFLNGKISIEMRVSCIYLHKLS